jgi:two-component system response regulator PilR (NtrC family)
MIDSKDCFNIYYNGMAQRILIIDDDESVRDLLETVFKDQGFDVTTATNGKEGLELLQNEHFDLFIVDLVMPEMGGIDLLKNASSLNIDTPSIVITAFATVNTAVEAMKLGAFDYITKPFSLDELMIVVKRCLEVSRLKKENISLKKQLKQRFDFGGLIGNSLEMQKVFDLIKKIADTDSTVLIYGESGTGKELVAKVIHYNSHRSQKPFVPLNCAAIPKDLLESELFGHEKGAFTGAINTRIGRFELANGGTIFLDEVGELHPSLQVKLLRVLQEREFERVGSTRTIKIDVRILAATNRDLEKAIADGIFREDLYYRLNVIPLKLPPLRDRKEDIPVLIDHFIHKFSKRKKKEEIVISPEAMNCLMNYQWPGNVRELENTVERLVILCDKVVTIDDLPERIKIGTGAVNLCQKEVTIEKRELDKFLLPDSGIDLNSLIDKIERDLIIQAIEKTKGVKSKAATLLGLNRTTLIEKMKKKGLLQNSTHIFESE